MAIDLQELLAPAHTALVTMELQRGTVGDHSPLPALVEAAEQRGVVAGAVRLASTAREHGVRVVHCTVAYRPDLVATPANAPLLAALHRHPGHLVEATPSAELVAGLGPDPADIVSSRRHGVSPFGGTSLDQTLRSIGATTLVVVGVSLNVGVFGLCVEAVNLGYRVALVTDAVVGVPPEYGDALVADSLALLATRVTVDEVVTVWSRAATWI